MIKMLGTYIYIHNILFVLLNKHVRNLEQNILNFERNVRIFKHNVVILKIRFLILNKCSYF